MKQTSISEQKKIKNKKQKKKQQHSSCVSFFFFLSSDAFAGKIPKSEPVMKLHEVSVKVVHSAGSDSIVFPTSACGVLQDTISTWVHSASPH